MISFSKKKKEEKEKKELAEITAVVDELAYKWSIPQHIIRNIIRRWQKYECEKFGVKY